MKFSVCVPTLNAGDLWGHFWAALAAQSECPNEVIVLDSSSTDGTAEIASRDGARVVKIARGDFAHGATRQLGAELAGDVDVILYLTQDSILADRDSFRRLLSHFDDPQIGAAYGRQLPRRGAGPIEAHARLFNYPEQSAKRSLESVQRVGFKTIFFSNAFGAYRRAVLMDIGGFPPGARFGEDTLVVAKMVLAGFKVAYAANATVYHSHNYSLAQEFRRYVQVGRMHGAESWLREYFGTAAGEGLRFVRSELSYLSKKAPHLCAHALVRSAMKYVGYSVGRRTAALSQGESSRARWSGGFSGRPASSSMRLKGGLGNGTPTIQQNPNE
jgi:rhamnosyltransferase